MRTPLLIYTEYKPFQSIFDFLLCPFECSYPENSLSPQKQIVLKQILEEKARYCGCQFVIATHSPFLMALEGAKIYDLDAVPVDIKKWWELPNTRTYYEFFRDNAEFFERTDSDRRG